jgi:tetratricopeptide (TPR) repeat protein
MDLVAKDNGAAALARKGYWPALARKYFDEGKYSKAVELCLRMLEDEPDVLSGRVILACSLYLAGQYERARERFLEILRRDPANLVALKHLGDIFFRDGEEAAAMAYYRQVFEIDPCCRGLYCPVDKKETVQTRQLTLKRPGEKITKKQRMPLQEPAFITETIGDIYCDQGYYQLAGEVYRRLMVGNENSRIAEKLKEVERKLGIKEEQV